MPTRWNMTDEESGDEIKKLIFVMSGVNSADKLAEIQGMLAEVATGGSGSMPADEALKRMEELLESDLGGKSARRAELALRTVVFRAKATQKYRTLMAQRKIFPYWEYKARDDGRARDTHLALNGKIFPAGHEIWQRIFGPWAWGCRCTVIPRRGKDIDRMRDADNKKAEEDRRIWDQDFADAIAKNERLPNGMSLSTEDAYRSPAESGMMLWTEEELKERYADHPVIQKRFNLYMGKMPEKLKNITPNQITDLTKHRKKHPAVGDALKPKSNRRKLVEKVSGIIDEVHGDGVLPSIPVDSITDAPSVLGEFARSIDAATPMRIGVRNGNLWPELTLVHELGHFVDMSGFADRRFKNERKFGSERAKGVFELWLDTVKASPTFSRIPNVDDGYWLRNRELFARCYAQWIALRSGHQLLKDQLDIIRKAPASWQQWPDDEFKPIANAMDVIFDSKDWLRPKNKK